jgi:hypothetical protein
VGGAGYGSRGVEEADSMVLVGSAPCRIDGGAIESNSVHFIPHTYFVEGTIEVAFV